MTYQEFLQSKRVLAEPCGFQIDPATINPMLFDWQRDILIWDLERGKAANFMHTGTGKGPIQMEWCRHVSLHTGMPTMILAPLAVSQQFEREAAKFHIPITVAEDQSEVRPGVNVTNYERIHHFDLEGFAGVALDESSCIKDWASKTTKDLISRLAKTPYKLCSSATPSPNDHVELGTHAELLDVMTRSQMLAMFFEHDGGETAKWQLKGHGKRPFWQFISSWAVCLKTPSDLGYSDDGYKLPPLHMHEHIVPVDHSVNTDGMLFRCPDLSATGLHKELRLTADARGKKVGQLVRKKKHSPWLLWVNTDYEAAAVRKYVPEAVEVKGSDSPAKKKDALNAFSKGDIEILLSKTSICGFGMNWQHCGDMTFFGGYSFEQFFQGVRRCWRFGRKGPVNAHMVIAETEGPVLASMKRKERQYEELQSEMNAAMREEQLAARHKKTRYEHETEMEVPAWLTTQNY